LCVICWNYRSPGVSLPSSLTTNPGSLQNNQPRHRYCANSPRP
jgi:hypothetical protein